MGLADYGGLAPLLAAHGFGRDPGLLAVAGELDDLAPGVEAEADSPYDSAVASVPAYQLRAAELDAEADALEAEGNRSKDAALVAKAHRLRAQAARIRDRAAVLATRLAAHIEGSEYHSTSQDAAETAFWA